MSPESKERDLFIVDNSVSGWTGLRYLKEWTSVANAFDIATGYFEIGALLALEWKVATVRQDPNLDGRGDHAPYAQGPVRSGQG